MILYTSGRCIYLSHNILPFNRIQFHTLNDGRTKKLKNSHWLEKFLNRSENEFGSFENCLTDWKNYLAN